MDAATIQSKIYAGYGKAAARVGYLYTIYRPLSPPHSAPTPYSALSPLNKVGTINASFDNANEANFPYDKPNDFKGILWSGLFDATNVFRGDYLVNGSKTFYVAGKQDLLPPLCVECSRTFSVYRPTTPASSVGLQSYSGVTPSDETLIASGFPGAMQWSREGQKPYLDLPSDAPKKIGWLVFLPTLPGGAMIRERDFLVDDLGRRHLAMGIYLSDLGYRIAAELMQA